MKLRTVGAPEGGSLSVVYSCPECGYEMAMLTNPYETQLVQSLGVRIGPSTELGAGPAEAAAKAGEAPAATGASKCPFPAMMLGLEGAPAREGHAVQTAEAITVRWTPAAEARLANIPAFVRPMARTGIEKFARDRGSFEVDEKMLDAAREFFGM
jgi:hypothetical protein